MTMVCDRCGETFEYPEFSIRTMQFKDGKWVDDEYPVKFWMPIPRIPKEDE